MVLPAPKKPDKTVTGNFFGSHLIQLLQLSCIYINYKALICQLLRLKSEYVWQIQQQNPDFHNDWNLVFDNLEKNLGLDWVNN